MRAAGHLAPVRIKANALGNSEDLWVSPQHRMYIGNSNAELMFGSSEVLVAAKALVNDDTIRQIEGGQVEYFHVLFQNHEIIYANGCPSESFHPGREGWDTLELASRRELCELFPEFATGNFDVYGCAVRYTLKPHELKALRGAQGATLH